MNNRREKRKKFYKEIIEADRKDEFSFCFYRKFERLRVEGSSKNFFFGQVLFLSLPFTQADWEAEKLKRGTHLSQPKAVRYRPRIFFVLPFLRVAQGDNSPDQTRER